MGIIGSIPAAEENSAVSYMADDRNGRYPHIQYETRLSGMCEVKRISGILNSTTNTYSASWQKATSVQRLFPAKEKKRGFIEANPSTDMGGYDAAAKLLCLPTCVMDADMTPLDVEREGMNI